MSAPPPRRRRRREEPLVRTIPFPLLALIVVVGGFAIGMAFSFVRTRGSETDDRTNVVIRTPEPKATQAPIASPVASPESTVVPIAAAPTHPPATPPPAAAPSPVVPRAPSPRPTLPSPLPSGSPSPPPTVAPTERPSPTPRARPTHAPTPRATAPSSPAPVVTVAPRVVRAAPVARTPGPGAAPAGAPVTVTGTDAAFGRQAVGVVQTYLNALMRGDENTAFAQLGGTAANRNLSLDEEAILPPGAHVAAYHAQAHGEASATVEAEIVSPKGTYFATYQVANGPGGAIITSHEYIQP